MKLKSLKYLFMPSRWVVLGSYSKELDAIINHAIDNDNVYLVNGFYCRIGQLKVWVENHPYGFGMVSSLRPSRPTVDRLYAHILKIGHKSRDHVEAEKMHKLVGEKYEEECRK